MSRREARNRRRIYQFASALCTAYIFLLWPMLFLGPSHSHTVQVYWSGVIIPLLLIAIVISVRRKSRARRQAREARRKEAERRRGIRYEVVYLGPRGNRLNDSEGAASTGTYEWTPYEEGSSER